jgi:hypothetical protein
MSAHLPLAPGIFQSSLVDQEIAHIRRVMPLSLSGDLGGPILPAPYWRRRLLQLLDTGVVSKGQLAQIDNLLTQLDEFERQTAAGAGDSDADGETPIPSPRTSPETR